MEMMKKPRELKGGIYTKCDCTYRNGLQDSCLREDCKRPKRERSMKSMENSFDIERTISHMTQPHMSHNMTKLGPSFNGLTDYANQSGGNQMGGFYTQQSYPLNQQLNMSDYQQEGGYLPPTSYNAVPENSMFNPLSNTTTTTISPAGLNALGLGNLFNSMNGGGGGMPGGMGTAMTGGMGAAMTGGMGNGMPSGMGNNMAGMAQMTGFNGMGGGNMSGMGGNNMPNMAGMAGMTNMGNMSGMGNMGNLSGLSGLGGLSGMAGASGMNNLSSMSAPMNAGMGGGMNSGMSGGMSGGMNSGMGGGMYGSFPMNGFGDGQIQAMSQCY